MTSFAPDLGWVRTNYAKSQFVYGDPDRTRLAMMTEFDRWLEAHDAAIRASLSEDDILARFGSLGSAAIRRILDEGAAVIEERTECGVFE